MITTALRSGAHEVRDGVRLLRADPDIPYRDGAEERLWEIIGSATDLSSDSTEMLENAKGWAERYHTHPARANIVRALDIPADARVLEVGAGCGPITRYLGETAALVDSVEPVLPRARVGRARTRDLPNVEVFCGNLEDVPSDPIYDLVVVVGVLEYVGAGDPDPEPYLSFLRECRTRLRPGGSLVLAIENKLGVKYLTGTGEDHSGRLFDSIEDYPRGSPARTFSATALLELVSSCGLEPRLFGVFPDYKHTRVVFDTDALHAAAPRLLENLPAFPSRFAGTRSIRLASEERVWKELVRDGLGAHFSNSFLIIADTESPARLWPEDRFAKYFSINRRPAYLAATDVRRVDGGTRLDRTYSAAPGPLITGGDSGWDYAPGASFLETFYAADPAGRRDLLERWVELVRASVGRELVPLDAIPTNLIVSETGALQLIDSEFHDRVTFDRVVVRGLFWLAVHLAGSTPPEVWSPAGSVGELMAEIGASIGIEVDDDVVGRFLEDESLFQFTVSAHYLGPDGLTDTRDALTGIHRSRLWDMPLGKRLHHRYDESVAEQERLQVELRATAAERDRLTVRYAKAAAARDRLREKTRVQRQQIAELRRAAKDARAVSRRTAKTLAGYEASRGHRLVESLQREVTKVRRRVRRRPQPPSS